MGSGPVVSNTSLDEKDRRRLESAGPMGFIKAVKHTLDRLGRSYYYAGAVPPWLEADQPGHTGRSVPRQEAGEDERHSDEDVDEVTDRAVIHTHRIYPAKRMNAGTSDSASGSRRQKTPNEVIYHDRPLPSSTLQEEAEKNDLSCDDPKDRIRQADPHAPSGKKPPLWDDREQIPDMFADEVDEDTRFMVHPYNYDVFVDFTLLAPNTMEVQQMETDFFTILRTFHDRFHTGSSNLTGWFYQAVDDPPPSISDAVPDNMPSRTITWRLQQTVGYGFPVTVLNEIHMDLYGQPKVQ